MHFRFRGNNIQVVRSQPDPSTGKAKSTPLGSINRASLEVSEKLRQNCTPAELREIEAWVKRHQFVDQLKTRHAALTLPEQMAAAAATLHLRAPVHFYSTTEAPASWKKAFFASVLDRCTRKTPTRSFWRSIQPWVPKAPP